MRAVGYIRVSTLQQASEVYVFESVSTGVAINIAHIRSLDSGQLGEQIVQFKQNPTFVENTGAGANIKSKLNNRIQFAISFFGGTGPNDD